MRLLRRVLLGPEVPPVDVVAPTGTLWTATLSENAGLSEQLTLRCRFGVVRAESVSASSTAISSPLLLRVTAPLDGSSTTFPFTATGTATRGATIRIYNTVNNSLLGTTVADAVTGNWSIQINSL